MACEKNNRKCSECEYRRFKEKCPGINFWLALCNLPEKTKDEIVDPDAKKTFGPLFSTLQRKLSKINFNLLSSNKVSLLNRVELISLLSVIRMNSNYHFDSLEGKLVTKPTKELQKLLFNTMIYIHENENNITFKDETTK